MFLFGNEAARGGSHFNLAGTQQKYDFHVIALK